MTTAPDTIKHAGHIYVRWDVAAALTSRTISGFLHEVNGWTDEERAEVVAAAEKATPCAAGANPGASEGEGVAVDLSRRNPNYGRVNGDVEDIVYGVKPKRRRKVVPHATE